MEADLCHVCWGTTNEPLECVTCRQQHCESCASAGMVCDHCDRYRCARCASESQKAAGVCCGEQQVLPFPEKLRGNDGDNQWHWPSGGGAAA